MNNLTYNNANEIYIGELISFVWKEKLRIIAISMVFAIGSVIYALSLKDIYTAQVLLAPAEETKGGGLSALAGKFGGLASLAGINLGKSEGNKVNIALATLMSRSFIKKFASETQIAIPLIAAKKWNKDIEEFEIDPEVYDTQSSTWVREVSPPKKTIPTDWEVYKKMEKTLYVDEDEKTGLITVSFESISPKYAKIWVDRLIKELNEYIKEDERQQALKSIEFLSKQLDKTKVMDMRKVFSQLIEEQTKTLMLTETRNEYVFKTIDESVVPEEKSKPSRAIICILITFLGGVIGVLVSIFRYLNLRIKQQD